MAKESRAFGSQRGRKAHLTLGKRGMGGEVADLRSDVEEGFQNLEERAEYPELDFIDGAGPAAAGGDMVLVGRNLLQGQSFDELQLIEGAADLTVHALKPGASPLSVEITVGAGALSAVIAANKLTIELQAAGDTYDDIATAINVSATCDGVVRAVSAAGGSFTLAQAEADLAGGVGDYAGNKVMAAGKECLPANETGTTTTAKWSDTGITVTAPALSPAVATDKAQVTVSSDGTRADALSAAVE